MRVRFEEDEMFVMAMFKKENRLATMQEIRRILPFIKEDGEMLALVNHTLEKMDQLTDWLIILWKRWISLRIRNLRQ